MEEPYLGPRPFGTDLEYQKRFFGRDYESEEILSLLLSHDTVLVYAQSGAGKTSIFNAKILPNLKERGYEILPTARVKITSTFPTTQANSSESLPEIKSTATPIPNIYMFNAMHSMKPDVDPSLVINKSLTDFLENYFPPKKDKRGRNQPQIIIFDQFEELFTVHTKNYRNLQEEFFRQIVEALDHNPLLGVAFIIREEYIAQLQPFVAILPDRLRYRFRLERLTKDNAFAAVRKPLMELGLYHEELEQDINNIVKNLEDEGGYVEPIHLQVVCQRWWRQRMSIKEGVQNRGIVDNIADLDQALEEFYVNAVADAENQTNVSEADIRDWCEHQLITSTETRGIVHQTPDATAGMSNKVVETLDKDYLIRPEIRSGDYWYELTHDRLVKPIKNSNQIWRENERTRKSKRNKLIIVPSVVGAVALMIFILPNLYSIYGPHPVQKEILLGQTPSYLAANVGLDTIYVSNHDNNSISVIDGKTNKVLHTIQVGHTPSELAVLSNNANDTIYVSNHDNNSISVIDGKTNKVNPKNIKLENILLKQTPSHAAVNPSTGLIYVAGSNSTFGIHSITVLDGIASKVNTTIPLDYTPTYLSINPETNMIYAAGSTDDYSSRSSVTVINGTTNKPTTNIPLNQSPFYMSVSPDTNTIYVAGHEYGQNSSVTIINGTTNQVERYIPYTTNQAVTPVLINPETKVIYAVDYNYTSNTGFLTILDGKTNKTLGEDIPVNSSVIPKLSLNPRTNVLYLVGHNDTSGSDFITAVNGTTNEVITNDLLQGSLISPRLFLDPVTNITYLVGQNVTASLPSINAINGTTNETITKDLLLENLISPRLYHDSTLYPESETNVVYLVGHNFTSDRDLITAINGTTNDVIAKDIPTDLSLRSFSINPKTNMIYLNGFNSTSNTTSVNVIDSKNKKMIHNIPIGQATFDSSYEGSVSVNPKTNMIYSSGSSGYPDYNHTITIINGTTNHVMKNITLDHTPISLSVNPKTNMIYSAGSSGYPDYNHTITVINGTTNEVNTTIPLDQYPTYIYVDPKTSMMYVAEQNFSSDRNSVIGINSTTNKLITDLPINETISYLSVDPKTSRLYVVGYNLTSEKGSINIIDGLTNRSISETKFPVGHRPWFINPESNLVYLTVPNSSSDTSSISVINGTTTRVLANNIPTQEEIPDMDKGPTRNMFYINPKTNMIYLAGSNSTTGNGSVTVINGRTNKLVTNIPLDQPPSLLASSKTSLIDVVAYNSTSEKGSLTVINGTTNKVKGHIKLDDLPITQTPSFISVNNNTNLVYVTGFNSTERVGSISIINGTTNKLKQTILLGRYPPYVSLNPETNRIYVAAGDFLYGTISVINGKTNEMGPPIQLDQRPLFMSVNAKTNMIYVVGDRSITVINGTTNIKESAIPFNAAGISAMSINPITNMIYALDSDSLLVINGTSNELDADITVDKNVFGLSVMPETNMIYVSDLDSNVVYTINGKDNRKDQSVFGPKPPTVKISGEPSDIFVNSKINMIYTLSPDFISAINGSTGKVNANIRVDRASAVLINPVTKMIYIGGVNSTGPYTSGSSDYPDYNYAITVINGTTNEVNTTIPLDKRPVNMSVNPTTNIIYVSHSASYPYLGAITVINGTTNHVMENITLDYIPISLSINPKTNMIYVAGSSDYPDYNYTITVINGATNEVNTTIPLDKQPSDLFADPKTNLIYATGFSGYPDYNHTVTIINGTTNEEISEIPLSGELSYGLKIYSNPVTNSIYNLDSANHITVINSTTNEVIDHIQSIKRLSEDSDVAIDNNTNMIYLLISDPNSISRLDSKSIIFINGSTDKVIDDLPLANIGSADAIDINPLTHTIYVVSKSSNSVTAINGTTHKILTNFNR